MSALDQLGAFVAHGAERIPPAILDRLRLHVADTIGGWVAATSIAQGRALSRLRVPQETDSQTGNVLNDLAINCALARLSEIDDIHLASMTTPGGIIIPAALTLAQRLDAKPESLIAAIVVGYEAMIRLGLAIDGPTILYRGIWPTYFTAPFATAAVAARLLGLDASQTADALALALTLAAPGVGHHSAATTSRWFAVGQAARHGVTAAFAAQQGFTSDRNILESAFLRDVYGITPQLGALVDGLGGRYGLAEISCKPWCAARQTMAATFGLKQIMDDGLAATDVTAIDVFVPPPQVKMVDHGVNAGDRASHLTSVPYQMAVAAITPDAAYDVAQSPSVLSDDVRAFMQKIKVAPDERLLSDYPRLWRARLSVTSTRGEREREVSDVPGDPALAFDADGIKHKFHRFVGPILGADAAERLLQSSLSALDQQQSRQTLTHQLAAHY